jgi:hypothetical protein
MPADGSCSVSKRTKLVAALNDFGRDQFVFLLSSKAGGCGLNLVGANRLILFDPDWNPATDKQAAARVWRDGQKKKVYEYRFLASGSIEEKVFQRQLSKEGLATIVNNGTNETSSFSKDELRELFAVNPTVTSDTLNSFKQRELEDAGDLDSEDAGGSGTATKSDPPKNPLSINPHVIIASSDAFRASSTTSLLSYVVCAGRVRRIQATARPAGGSPAVAARTPLSAGIPHDQRHSVTPSCG